MREMIGIDATYDRDGHRPDGSMARERTRMSMIVLPVFVSTICRHGSPSHRAR
ncbi:hypothetical protein [Methylobacterium sp. NEAU K]|uniref:hypothetical protein n=1 Tax=Methylobacterium sp. NEAU K TaxID=3064946 RepID=UPI002734F742|nr:hypothetical protein [Methylobacterium sp. NEAU K]